MHSTFNFMFRFLFVSFYVILLHFPFSAPQELINVHNFCILCILPFVTSSFMCSSLMSLRTALPFDE